MNSVLHRVVISCAADATADAERLAERLAHAGLDVAPVQPVGPGLLSPQRRRALKLADVVVVVGSAGYRESAAATVAGDGSGIPSEADHLIGLLAGDGAAWRSRIVSVILPAGGPGDLPAGLGGDAVRVVPLERLDDEEAASLARLIRGPGTWDRLVETAGAPMLAYQNFVGRIARRWLRHGGDAIRPSPVPEAVGERDWLELVTGRHVIEPDATRRLRGPLEGLLSQVDQLIDNGSFPDELDEAEVAGDRKFLGDELRRSHDDRLDATVIVPVTSRLVRAVATAPTIDAVGRDLMLGLLPAGGDSPVLLPESVVTVIEEVIEEDQLDLPDGMGVRDWIGFHLGWLNRSARDRYESEIGAASAVVQIAMALGLTGVSSVVVAAWLAVLVACWGPPAEDS